MNIIIPLYNYNYPGKRRFDHNDIRLIENAASGTTTDSPMVILIDEWSSMGKIRFVCIFFCSCFLGPNHLLH